MSLPILGPETITVEQCNNFIKKVNINAPNIIVYYKKYGERLGIRWGYAVAQMLKETGYLKFGGTVTPEQNNFAGIGTVSSGAKGAYFTTKEEGVLAHLEHLYAYASKNPLSADMAKVDPRFDLVSRGSCPNWEDLNGHWAIPGNGYGEAIGKIYDQMIKEGVTNQKGDVSVEKIVCIDPGHGGYDPGTVGNGLQEKDLTLDICLKLKPLLEYNAISVVLTRAGDYAPGHLENNLNGELNARVDIAEQNKVDLFVSVHINSGGGTGQEILISGTGGNAETAANKVLPYLVQAGGWVNRGVKTQNVLVLNKTSMPAILTESGFIDSTTDTGKLKDSGFRQTLAVAHAKGICDHFGIQYKEKEDEDMLEVAVLLNTKEDYWAGADVAAKNGNCAIFVRGADKSIPAEAMSAKKLIVVGGATTKHLNEVLLSGQTKFDTAAAVGKYLE